METFPQNIFPPSILTPTVSEIGFPSLLPLELALKVCPEDEILEAYNLSPEQFMAIRESPAFIAAFKNACEMVQQEGMSFKIKAKIQAEELLAHSYSMATSRDTPASVRADIIKATVRWAGYEPKAEHANGGVGNALQININLDGR